MDEAAGEELLTEAASGPQVAADMELQLHSASAPQMAEAVETTVTPQTQLQNAASSVKT